MSDTILLSEITTLRQLEEAYDTAGLNLSSEIHRVYKPDTKVDYMVGAPDWDWQPYEVVGPRDRFNIYIRAIDRTGKNFTDDIAIDGRSHRLRLTEVKK